METFRALLVVDAEKFSAHRDSELPDVHREIRRVLAAACAGSGLREAWEAVKFMESTGDGVLAMLPLESAPALVDVFPRRLQEALAACAPELRARGLRLRLRVALHYGLVDDERPGAPGISTATIDVNRLLDAEPLRDALSGSDPEITFAAFLLSAELFGTYVEGGRTKLRESQFTEVRVKVKQYERPAYLYVPVPSLTRTPPPPTPPSPREDGPVPVPGAPSISGVTIDGDRTQNVFGNNIGRDFHQEGS
ncbi:hypothetical protein [Actinomadura sp. DC4]|uniref:hypothetical protein n=1 Tax=Actinomadura sp. DC4 TaxID=3055069 RepID=UPI0025B1FF91|nr:hypothetical protein [Actinomadura sp. DC4]MDN3359626.1 hypothetical protein [Actinomadura sp. DC4]